MATKRTQRDAARVIRGGIAAQAMAVAAPAAAQQASPDERARLTEQQMTDDERFLLLISILGNVEGGAFPPDPRIPSDLKNPSAGYTPGIPRLGVPALQSSDASMGVTNPGYRPDDKGATAFPASIVVGSSFNPAARARGGRGHRPRGADPELQHHAGGRNEPRPRRAQTGGISSTTARIPGTAPSSPPSRSTAFRVNRSFPRSSTTRSTATRRTATGSTRSSTLRPIANPICSPFRS
jgi:hypothetical protein